MVCAGTSCESAGSPGLREALTAELEKRGLGKEILVVQTGCNGLCARGPTCVVKPEGVFYEGLTAKDAPELVEQHYVKGKPLERLLYKGEAGRIPLEKDIPFFAKQPGVVRPRRSLIDPERIEDAIAHGAYQALAKILAAKTSGEAVIEEILRSGLRGRGGGGFPTGLKWRDCLEAARERGVKPFVACNCEAGAPGAFMDRYLLEADPHLVIEGMCIAACALGAAEGFVYTRREYPLALERLGRAIEQARQWGLLGEGILGTGFSFDITVHEGAGAFVCGESSALMASMEGLPAEPRAKYVHSVESGYRKSPTVLNNVETWSNVPGIIERGGAWFAAQGTGDVSKSPWNGSSGTKVLSLMGNVVNSGIVEVPMGMTLGEIVRDLGGGVPNGRSIKAVQTGGPSGGCIPASMLDMPLSFDSLKQAGSMMGAGGMIVMDDGTCMVDVARNFIEFLADESCGKCTPCRDGLAIAFGILDRISKGEGKAEDLTLLGDICGMLEDGALCGLGQTAANPIGSTLRHFREEYEAHILQKKCPAGVCKALVTVTIDPVKCTGCRACVKPCPTSAITGEKKQVHVIDQDKCIKCGICRDACKFDAVIIG
ncbi:MAG: NADH-ubiquinone oxidoreductase-F iron-sulfur binding region domain-containing protein [Polyangia bacterium]|nr:NADH-ubiquinone oxidoreductase-F iron-sulfur binding region domain-containing protein [Polyangia bacterium]